MYIAGCSILVRGERITLVMLVIMLLLQQVPSCQEEQRGHCQEAEGRADSGTDSFCSEWLQKN
jgi:hypothetical protein